MRVSKFDRRICRFLLDGTQGTRPPSTTLSAASQAASKPEDSLARPIDLSVRLLPAESIRSIPSTSPGGMSRLIVDSPKALGLAMVDWLH